MKLCAYCSGEITGFRKLFCSDRCQANAHLALKKEEDFIKQQERIAEKTKRTLEQNKENLERTKEILANENLINSEIRRLQAERVGMEVFGGINSLSPSELSLLAKVNSDDKTTTNF
jgi:hypothetical protein